MTRADEINRLADMVAKGPPSRYLDVECEKVLRGLLVRLIMPKERYSSPECATQTIARLRARSLEV